MNTNQVLQEVARDRLRQRKLRGDRRHPDGTGKHLVFPLSIGFDNVEQFPAGVLADIFAEEAGSAKRYGELSWRDVLLGETFRAISISDYSRLREGLVQIASVCVEWVEDIDSRVHDRREGGSDGEY